jgi:hypothetical protein
MTLLRCTQTFLEIRPCRARPGRAKPSQAGQGRRLGPAPGQPLDLASLRKTVDSCTRNAHFRAGPPKLIVSCTRNDHFQNSIHTSALDDLRKNQGWLHTFFGSEQKRHTSAAKYVVISAPKKQVSLLNVTVRSATNPILLFERHETAALSDHIEFGGIPWGDAICQNKSKTKKQNSREPPIPPGFSWTRPGMIKRHLPYIYIYIYP